MTSLDSFKPIAKAIAIRGGTPFEGRVMPGGAQATPVPLSGGAQAVRGAATNSFMPVQGAHEVRLAGSTAPPSMGGPAQPPPQAAPQVPQGSPAPGARFQPLPASPSVGSGPYLQRPEGQKAVLRITLSAQTPDGKVWDSQHDALFPPDAQFTGPPVVERLQ